MQMRKIGGLQVSEIGLGCMGMSFAYGERDEGESLRTLQRALDLGVSFWDTADVYGQGHNEELLAKALKGNRDRVVLATKFANSVGKDGKFVVRGDREYVLSACENSLRRLGTDVIDLYYAHRIDPKVPIEETVGAMKTLVEQGKVRHIGLSEASPATIRKAHAVHPIAALQTEYSLWTRDVEEAILPTCRELGIGFVAYSPLGRGFLTGTIEGTDSLSESDRRHLHPRFSRENMEKNMRLVEVLRKAGKEMGATPAQIALGWVLSRGEDVVPIPGTKKVKWLEENVAATELKLSAGLLSELEKTFAPGVTAGLRYPERDMAKLNL
jgi:aryl-alcohol dehydrogenase-like predicted oxidoreductase